MIDGTGVRTLSQVYGVLGNALLTVPSSPEMPHLMPDFWDGFPKEISHEYVERGLRQISACLVGTSACPKQNVERIALEYTRLFIGPPSPAAPPWESFNRGGEDAVGFGKPAFVMAKLLEEKGLHVSNKNNQYPDHMGIELLFLSYLCDRCPEDLNAVASEEMRVFIEQRPLGWASVLRKNIEEVYPEGLYAGIMLIVEGTLIWHRDALEALLANASLGD